MYDIMPIGFQFHLGGCRMKCKNANCDHEVDVKTGRGRKPKYCLDCRTTRVTKAAERKAAKAAKQV